jgi:hypothetical protein
MLVANRGRGEEGKRGAEREGGAWRGGEGANGKRGGLQGTGSVRFFCSGDLAHGGWPAES